MYWANSRRVTAVQRINAGIGEREEEEEVLGNEADGSALESLELINVFM